jgi:hypothetical protein
VDVVGGLAVAGLAVGGADVVAELCDLDGRPVEVRQSGDDAGHDRGLADVAGVSADDDGWHGEGEWLVVSR